MFVGLLYCAMIKSVNEYKYYNIKNEKEKKMNKPKDKNSIKSQAIMDDEAYARQLSNDLNVANTITILYDLLKDDSVNGNTKLKLINDFDKVWSLNLTTSTEEDSELVKYIEEKIQERAEAKKNKDFALADQIRNELLEKGVELLDTREGTKYKIN